MSIPTVRPVQRDGGGLVSTMSADGQVTYDISPENRKKMQGQGQGQGQGPSSEEIDALELNFRYDEKSEKVNNVYIKVKVGPTIDCRQHYAMEGFKRVKVLYNCGGSLQIVATGSSNNKDGYLFIPNTNILSVGVDIKSTSQ